MRHLVQPIDVTRRQLLLLAGLGSASWAAGEPRDVPQPPITCLVFSPDGNQLISGSQAGVMIRDCGSLVVIDELSVSMEQVHDLVCSPAGDRLAVVGGDPGESGRVTLFAWPTRRRIERLTCAADVGYALSFSPSGDRWVVASHDETVVVCKTARAHSVRTFDQHSGSVLAACFLPDGEQIVSAGRDQTLRVWNAETGESIRTLHNHTDDVAVLRVRPGASGLPMVASASADQTVRFWQPTIGRMVRFIRLPSRPLDIAWTPDGQQVIALCVDGKARQIDVDRVTILATTDVFDGWGYSVAIDQATGRIACGGPDGAVKLIRFS